MNLKAAPRARQQAAGQNDFYDVASTMPEAGIKIEQWQVINHMDGELQVQGTSFDGALTWQGSVNPAGQHPTPGNEGGVRIDIHHPEQVDTYEIGTKNTFDGRFPATLKLAVFYNDFRDQQLQNGKRIRCLVGRY